MTNYPQVSFMLPTYYYYVQCTRHNFLHVFCSGQRGRKRKGEGKTPEVGVHFYTAATEQERWHQQHRCFLCSVFVAQLLPPLFSLLSTHTQEKEQRASCAPHTHLEEEEREVMRGKKTAETELLVSHQRVAWALSLLSSSPSSSFLSPLLAAATCVKKPSPPPLARRDHHRLLPPCCLPSLSSVGTHEINLAPSLSRSNGSWLLVSCPSCAPSPPL